MTAFVRALGAGYSAQQILSYLSQHNPQMAQKITAALNAGHTVDHVMNFLSKNEKRFGRLFPEKQQKNPSSNLYKTAQSQIHPSLVGMAKFGATTAGLAAGAYAMSRAIPRIAQAAMQPGIQPQSPGQPPTSPVGPTSPATNVLNPMPQGNQAQAIQPTSQPPVNAPTLPQTDQPAQPEVIPNKLNIKDFSSKYQGFVKKMQDLKAAGNGVDEISGYFRKFAPSQVKELEKEYGMDIEQVVGQLLTSEKAPSGSAIQTMLSPAEEKTPEQEAPKQPISKKIDPSSLDFSDNIYDKYGGETFGEYAAMKEGSPVGVIDYSILGNLVHIKNIEVKSDMKRQGIGTHLLDNFKKEVVGNKKLELSYKTDEGSQFFKAIEKQPIEKNSTVISPQGVGEVKEIRNGKAIVEVDGKKHQVDEDELEKEPEDVIQTVQELLQIPEVDRSSVVSLFTYDPEDKQMFIQFHNGESFKYLDVDPEKVMTVANKMGIPVTQGKNIFGAWSPEDKKSLGATLIKEIINDPKYKKSKKGEADNPNYRKLDTLYDYWEKLRKKPKKKKNV